MQRVLIVLGFNLGNDLAGCDGIADRHVSFLHAAPDPESQIGLILGLDLARQADHFATWRVSHRRNTYRSDFDFLGLLVATCDKRQRNSDDEDIAFHSGTT